MQNNPLAAAGRALNNCLRRAAWAARPGTTDGLSSPTFGSGRLSVNLVLSF